MRDVRQVRERARRFYERHRGLWLRDMVAASLPARSSGRDQVDGPCPADLEIGLDPPSERLVLDRFDEVERWIRPWEEYRGPGDVMWEGRRWPSVGDQLLPVRVRFEGVEAISREAGRLGEWRLLVGRVRDIVELRRRLADASRELASAVALPDAIRRLTVAIAEIDEGDWQVALRVIGWLGFHRNVACFVRELPIRGIDTKWIEGHRKLVLGLARALYGLDALPFRKPPELIRVRALGAGILPKGFEDASLTAPELSSLSPRPRRVVVCENLISVLTMPAMEGTLALFGSGYGVGSRLAVPWLDDVELYYWGDLDTHGFRILDGFRRHHPGAVSVLMDERTLRDNEDLWVTEPEPFTAMLTRLTPEESAVFDFLRARDPAPRLEQERIPYERVERLFASLVDSSR